MGVDQRFRGWVPWRVETLVLEGSAAAASGAAPAMAAACAALDDCVEAHGWQEVAAVAGSVVCSVLASLFEGGWAPREVIHQLRRQQGASHADLGVAVMGAPDAWALAAGARPPGMWAAQLAEQGVNLAAGGRDWLLYWLAERAGHLGAAWPVVLETLGGLRRLPPIEPLIPRPSEWASWSGAGGGQGGDEAVLAKVRALLAKAESTTFAAESEALTAKAQELMARHSIVDAAARSQASSPDAPVTVRVLVDDPYAAAKAQLLGAIAAANDVRSVWYSHLAMTALVGYQSDIEMVETLFTSLLVQGTRAMITEGSLAGRRGRTRSFRQSFLLAFADRIGQRLKEASVAARRAAEHDLGGSVLPVLAGRRRQVDDAVTRQFPRLEPMAVAISNEAGWRAGRVAAEAASLGGHLDVLEETRA